MVTWCDDDGSRAALRTPWCRPLDGSASPQSARSFERFTESPPCQPPVRQSKCVVAGTAYSRTSEKRSTPPHRDLGASDQRGHGQRWLALGSAGLRTLPELGERTQLAVGQRLHRGRTVAS